MVSNEELIRRIEVLAQERGVSKANALKESGAGKDFIANMKKGQKPALDKTLMIASYFGVSVDALLNGEKLENSTSNSSDLFWQKFERLCFEKEKTPNAVCKEIGLSNATATYWKQGKVPTRRNVIAVAKYFNIDPDELLAPKKDLSEKEYKKIWPPEPVLNEYSWEHEGDSPFVKKYNAVCRAMYAMHGKVKGAALLSAIGLPSDAPADISEAQLDFLAFHTGTNASFFSVDRIGSASPSELSALSRMYGEYPKFCTIEELFMVHRDAIQWESDYKRLCMEAYQKRINMDYFNEIADTLARFRPVEQAKIMALFQAAVEQYEEKTNKKMDAAFAGTAAEKKGNVS